MGRVISIIWIAVAAMGCATSQGPVVHPLADHAGNVFLHGEEVSVVLAPGDEPAWQAVDYEHKVVAGGIASDGRANLGKLPVGYYEVTRKGATTRATAGVIAPLVAPTPQDTPIASDVAMSWFYDDLARKRGAASLCALAGIQWVRDRMSWPDIEKAPGEFAASNRSDSAARIQTEAGLRVLQVNHIAPRWQQDDPKRFPHDLRDAYRFYREVAGRWKGQVLAIEPWNEADIPPFGGHVGSEIASMQKASYLGLKAGNPDVIGCLNVFAVDQTAILDDYNDNEAWPYIDTYDFHHYAGIERYADVYANHRRVSAGKPMWVTECNVPVQWAGDPKLREPSDDMLRVQVRRVARVYSASIFNGATRTFYFILGDYVEGQTQFGALHADLTPRPAYLAMAASGRFLAGAKPLGQWKPEPEAYAYVFRAKPDGVDRDVLVAWAHKGSFTTQSALPIEAAFDCLGRPIQARTLADLSFGADPVFVILAKGSAQKLTLQPPPKDPELRKGSASKVVLQAMLPKEQVDLKKSAHTIAQSPPPISIFAYNFGDKPVKGTLMLLLPPGWQAHVDRELELAPGERKEIFLTVDPRGDTGTPRTLKIAGAFGSGGRAVLSLRLLPK